MDITVPSVVRGEFFYRDVLLVDVGGDLKKHPRASTSEIKSYLEGKAGKAGKDQVAHWYEAQVIHYGLQRTKDKNTAKVRLQQALGQEKLNVPSHLVDMEAQMKKEYASNVRKAKAAVSKAAANGELGGGKDSGKGKKRKQDDKETTAGAANKKTKITVKVGDMEISIDQASVEAIATKKKTTASKASKDTAMATSKANPTAAKGKADGNAPSNKAPTKGKAKNDQDQQAAAKTKASKSKNQASEESTTKSKTPAKPQEPTASKAAATKSAPKTKAEPKVKPEPKVKAEPKVKKEPAAKRAPVKTEPKIKPEPDLKDGLNPLQGNTDQDGDFDMDRQVDGPEERNITGVYNIICPQLAAQYPEEASNLRLFLCVDNDAQPSTKIWGGFQLGYMSGVLLMQDQYTGPATTVTFGWRARNAETGRLSFGRGCYGEVVFCGYSSVQGAFYNLFPETVQFQGDRRPGPLWCGRPAWKFEEEWEGYVKEAYGR